MIADLPPFDHYLYQAGLGAILFCAAVLTTFPVGRRQRIAVLIFGATFPVWMPFVHRGMLVPYRAIFSGLDVSYRGAEILHYGSLVVSCTIVTALFLGVTLRSLRYALVPFAGAVVTIGLMAASLFTKVDDSIGMYYKLFIPPVIWNIVTYVGFVLIEHGAPRLRSRAAVPCRKCGYELAGLPDETTLCPECGAERNRRRRRPNNTA